jgi:hypothetical protein
LSHAFPRLFATAPRRGVLLLAIACLLLLPDTALARVVRVTVDRRELIGNGATFGAAGPYERLVGRVYFAFDPKNPYDRGIVDLDRAPRNAAGEVEAWSEFVMLVPKDPQRRNGVTLVDVVNRGGMTVGVFQLGARRDAPPTDSASYGDAFLLRRGYTVVMLGWQWDILPGSNGLHFAPPVAGDSAHPITGLVRSDIIVDAPTHTIPLGHRVGTSQALGYPVSDTADVANVLTVRDLPLAPRRTVPRSAWRFARDEQGQVVFDPRSVYMPAGFEAGKIYEVVYRAKDPVVVGTGLAAVRDMISYLKHDPRASRRRRTGSPMACRRRGGSCAISSTRDSTPTKAVGRPSTGSSRTRAGQDAAASIIGSPSRPGTRRRTRRSSIRPTSSPSRAPRSAIHSPAHATACARTCRPARIRRRCSM